MIEFKKIITNYPLFDRAVLPFGEMPKAEGLGVCHKSSNWFFEFFV